MRIEQDPIAQFRNEIYHSLALGTRTETFDGSATANHTLAVIQVPSFFDPLNIAVDTYS